jgi:DNA helicase-2/ATP-dependent DNA helicase PcrA
MILALTFTDAGASAMRQRLVSFIGVDAYKIAIHTFHSFSNEIIQNNPDYFGVREFEPVTELERIDIAYRIIEELDENHPMKRLRGDIYYDAKKLLNLFQVMKDENWTETHIKNKVDEYIESLYFREEFKYKRANKKKGINAGDAKQHLIDKEFEKGKLLISAAGLYRRYNEILKELKRYDFSDMLIWVLNSWQNDDFFLRNFQERYQYLLIDEFQDTTKLQYDIAMTLMEYWDEPNIFAVGDSDQTILSFAGSRVDNIVDFITKYKGNKVFLQDNYRSNQHILDAAMKVIDNNAVRLSSIIGVDKTMVAALNTSSSEPRVLQFPTLTTEVAYIVDMIDTMYKENKSVSDIAIIYRKHRQADEYIAQFEARNIPYTIKRNVNVLDTVVINKLLIIIEYFVSLSGNNTGRTYNMLFKICHFDFWGVDISKVHEYFSMIMYNDKSEVEIPMDVKMILDSLTHLHEFVSNNELVLSINEIINNTGLLESLLLTGNQAREMQYLNTFYTWVKNETYKNPMMTLDDLLKTIERMRSNGLFLPVIDIVGSSNGVNLMTVHGSKGLEFETVFMIGATRNEWEKSRDGNMNFKLPDTLTKTVTEEKEEENRRLFYVGMTRAKTNLFISFATKNDANRVMEPSQYVIETGIDIQPVENINLKNYVENRFKQVRITTSVERAVIKERVENFILSPSSMNKYLSCPMTFYIENILRVPSPGHPSTVYGNGIHIAMKRFYDAYKSGKFLKLDVLFDEFRKYIMKHRSIIGDLEVKLKLKLGWDTINRLYAYYFASSSSATLNEYKLRRMDIDGVPVKTDIDKIEFNGLLATIVDYKTGNYASFKKKIAPPSDKEPLGGDYWRQGMFMVLAFEEMAKFKEWKFDKLRFDFLSDKEIDMREIAIDYSNTEMVRKLIVEVDKNIKDMKFELCDDPDCRWCSFLRTV